MQTRKALKALSKGVKAHDVSGDQLAGRRAKFLEQYERTEAEIFEKKSQLAVSTPYALALKKKLAKIAETENVDVPVIAKFDLYSGVGKVASRTSSDVGLKRLATHLERLWKNDSGGALTYGQVNSLVKMYKDQFPRSKAADAIKAECAKSGMHKLPVARLARIAGKIENQSDYDSVVIASGIGTDRPDHVRSRAFIRGLVAAKFGDSVEDVEADDMDLAQRVSNRVASLEKEADYDDALDLLAEARNLSDSLVETLDEASMELFDSSLERPGQLVQDLSKKIDEFVRDLTEAQSEASVSFEKKTPAPEAPTLEAPQAPTAPEAPAVEAPQAPEAPTVAPPTPEELAGVVPNKLNPRTWTYKQDKTPKTKSEPTPEELAGLKKKWYDPRSWGYKKVQSLLNDTYALMAELDNDSALNKKLSRFASKLAQIAPSMPVETELDQLNDIDGADPSSEIENMLQDPNESDAVADTSDVGSAENLLNEIGEATQEIVESAPPEAQGYIQHEMAEGHTGEPGSAEWGAEEILNEGHTAPPPTEQWLAEEEAELHNMGASKTAQGKYKERNPGSVELEDTGAVDVPEDMGNDIEPYISDDEFGVDFDRVDEWIDGAPDPLFDGLMDDMDIVAKVAADGKDIPLPKGKIKSQPHVTTYAKNIKEDGAKTLKASEIEDQILAGKRVSQAGITILVNDNNEVEIWNKSGGIACDMDNFDAAISDYMRLVERRIASIKSRVAASKLDFEYELVRVANVPCESCGTACTFEYTKHASDEYACTCGHAINAGSFMELEKVAQMQPTWQLTISYAGMDPGNRKALKWKLPSLLANAGSHRIEDESSEMMVASVWNTNKEGIAAIEKGIQSLGGTVQNRRIAQVGGPDMQDIPDAAPSDVVDVTEDVWPEEDILRQVRDLKQRGIQYGQMIQQMIQMGALGTDRPSPDAVDYLDSIIKKARKIAQMAQPQQVPQVAAPAPQGGPQSLPDMPIGELANAAFVNYKAQGMSMMEALKAFLSDHKERLANVGNGADGEIMGAIAANYTSSPAMPAAPAAPAGAPQSPEMSPVAAKSAQSKPNFDPIVRKPSDSVKVDKDPGKDSSTKAEIPTPGKPKTQHPPGGKLSPTKMAPDSSTKAKMPLPGKPKARHLPKDQSGVKLPNPKLDSDLSKKDPFKEPSLGATPSVKK